MAEVRSLGLLDMIRERRRQAQQLGRIIHPEPLITQLRRRKRIKVKLLVLQRAGDFVENVAKILRDPVSWESATASLVISNVLNKFIKF